MISIAIAAYNEEKWIGKTLEKVLSLPLKKEVIVVDDGSTDSTHRILEGFGRDILLLRNEKNMGKGYSIRRAMSIARGDSFVIQDGDGEYPPGNILRLVEEKEDADMVVGMRTMEIVALYRDVSVSSFLANKLFVKLMRIPDVFSGQRLLDTDFMRSLNLVSNGFEIETEMSLKALKAGGRIKFVPISYVPRSRKEGKKIGFWDFLKISKFYFLNAYHR